MSINKYQDVFPENFETLNSIIGTANNIYDRNIRIAGKTGTAQVKSIIETEYELLRVDKSLRDHALFVGYGPVEEPKLVVVAIIENGESGSAVAAPIAKRLIEEYQININES